ncbi:chromosome segregation protein SMC [Sphingomonas xanthus]|uniref:Chromosome partition protein Smc n=1 Tax=Sphingomonas xanthus TaxID=2594473 RepID=A0A516IQV4_9SPHN|nr:chromosome segregation protein SMC [Sphingomonas xanthus]QDP19259.1 chromosome segregation protein SMC [Sphingomonas xanthus]
MRFRRLKLSGFKSFVEPAELRIEPGLTGVVGPNGCGKSNLLEAIRWVMGEGSPKSLRGGGMEDVIFAGTATRPPRDFAEVSLLIEHEAGEGGSDLATESEVTRRIERGAGSAYRLDGRDVRQKDVSLLFADAATGAHSPALVSQGRIGAVIAAKPVERRMMLEEAAGISGLHARRKDAEAKLRATEANLQRLDELLSDQEARASALRRQARAAERYRALSDKIRLAEGRLVYARWHEADRAAVAALEEARACEREVHRLGEAMQAAQSLQEQAAAALAERREAAIAARDTGRTLAHELATARARRDTVVRRLAELVRLAEALSAETAREVALKADAARAIEALDQERKTIEERLADAETVAARIATELTAAEAASREAEAALAGLLAREAAMRAERRVADAALEAARSQWGRVEAEAERLASQLGNVGDGAIERAAIAQASRQSKQSEQELVRAEAALDEAEAQRAAAAATRDEAESALAAARAALSAANAERDALARALDHGGGAALAELRAAPGYELALAAALGEDIEAVLGDKGQRRWQGSEASASDPPLAPGLTRLLDHVDAPKALHRRLAQVGMAENDEGQPLAVGQRLVTRDGVLRRWDGFVSEGGGAAAAERLLRANRLAEIDRSLPPLQQVVRDAEGVRDGAAAAVEAHRQQAERARADAAMAERTGRDAARAGDSAAAALERLDAQRAGLEERKTDLAPLAEAARRAVDEAMAALAALPDPDTLGDEVGAARAAAAQAGEAVADCRARSATRARETAADRERHAAAGRESGEWRTRALQAERRLAETASRAMAMEEEQEELADQPDRHAIEIERLEQQGATSEARIAETLEAERNAQEAVTIAGRALAEAGEAFAAAREARAGAAARAEAQAGRRQEYARICGEKFQCPPPLLPERLGFAADDFADPEAEKDSLDRLTADRERIGPVNLVAEQELAELDTSREANIAEKDELAQAVLRLRGSIGSLNREGRIRLVDAFEKVNSHFGSLFTTLFDGGQAHLELVESDDPLEAGLEIMAQPPGKRLSTLTLLSGGEQALTAVALIFALFLTNPAPICVLDEVDAPLDDANVDRFCDLLDRMTGETDTRYLIVTHNAVTMSRMHRLYGVTMIERGVSRLVSVDLGGAEELLAAE